MKRNFIAFLCATGAFFIGLFVGLSVDTKIQIEEKPHIEENLHGELVSVYDGDTVKVNIPNWPSEIMPISVRVRGIDTPEIRGKCEKEKAQAKQARDFLQAMLENAKTIHLKAVEKGKYFRLIADVYADEKNVAELLILNGMARKYDGGKRLPWCE